MKRLWLATAVLLLLLGSTLGNSRYLDRLIHQLDEGLSAAHRLADNDDWTQAAKITQEVVDHWQEHDLYFHIMLPHRDIDEIHLLFQEVEEYLKLEETDQYTAANAKLMAQLALLAEMEQLNVKNIL